METVLTRAEDRALQAAQQLGDGSPGLREDDFSLRSLQQTLNPGYFKERHLYCSGPQKIYLPCILLGKLLGFA